MIGPLSLVINLLGMLSVSVESMGLGMRVMCPSTQSMLKGIQPSLGFFVLESKSTPSAQTGGKQPYPFSIPLVL